MLLLLWEAVLHRVVPSRSCPSWQPRRLDACQLQQKLLARAVLPTCCDCTAAAAVVASSSVYSTGCTADCNQCTAAGGAASSSVYMRASELYPLMSPARSRLPASQFSGLSGAESVEVGRWAGGRVGVGARQLQRQQQEEED